MSLPIWRCFSTNSLTLFSSLESRDNALISIGRVGVGGWRYLSCESRGMLRAFRIAAKIESSESVGWRSKRVDIFTG